MQMKAEYNSAFINVIYYLTFVITTLLFLSISNSLFSSPDSMITVNAVALVVVSEFKTSTPDESYTFSTYAF